MIVHFYTYYKEQSFKTCHLLQICFTWYCIILYCIVYCSVENEQKFARKGCEVYLFFSVIDGISTTYMLFSYLKGLGPKIDSKTSDKNWTI